MRRERALSRLRLGARDVSLHLRARATEGEGMTLPDWTPEETQALARGDARVEIDYRRVPVRVRVVPMEKPGAGRPGSAENKGRAGVAPSATQPTISAAAYRRRMGWPPV